MKGIWEEAGSELEVRWEKAGSEQVTWHASQTRASEGVNFLRAPLKTTFFDAVFCTNIINDFLKPNFTLLYFLYD